MEHAYILAALRTPIGRRAGGLSGVRADSLLAGLLQQLVQQTGVNPQEIGEVFAGCANQAGEDNRNVARMATLLAGFPDQVPAVTVNRLCASGLEAAIQGMRAIWVGEHQLVIAAGVESMSRAPWVMAKPSAAFAHGNPTMYDTSLGWRFPNAELAARFPLESMGETAENLAAAYGIERQAQDEFALASHQRALAAWQEGRFAAQVVPTLVPANERRQSQPDNVLQDEGPRADSTMEKLASLKPAFRASGTVTAGNSSTLNDGAAALLLGTKDAAKALGLAPLARLHDGTSVGVDPRMMGIGPVPATRRLLTRANLALGDIDLFELNEAFAAQCLAVMQELGLSHDKVNVNGGAIALGHPLGCSGARILTTLTHEMARRDVARGVATLCVGVGQGSAVLVCRD